MKIIIAAAAVWYLIIMPTVGDPRPSGAAPTAQDPHPVLPSIKTQENNHLFKPFEVDKAFGSEAACREDAANLMAYLTQHGLPPEARGNFVCTIQ